VLDENQEKLSKQTKATAIACSTPGEALKALQAAAKHLGLNEPELFSERFDGSNHSDSKEVNGPKINESTIKQWLASAVEHYRKTRLSV
jgi:glutamyl-Q tRNA(Asp) synthetase